jgi:hypothetical protein
MTTLELIELIIIVAVAVIGLVWFIIKAIKNKWFSKIYGFIKEAFREAEKTELKGKAKLEYALEYVEAACDKEGIPFKAIKKLVIVAIEKLVEGYNIDKKGK